MAQTLEIHLKGCRTAAPTPCVVGAYGSLSFLLKGVEHFKFRLRTGAHKEWLTPLLLFILSTFLNPPLKMSHFVIR